MALKGNGSKILDTHRQYTEGDKMENGHKSLSIAYAMKKKRKKMASGGEVDQDAPSLPGAQDFQSGFRKKTHYAEGGFVKEEKASGYEEMPEEHDLMNGPAMAEDHKGLNQHKVGKHDSLKDDLVDRIMEKMSPDYSSEARLSEGGMVANDTGNGQVADEMPNQYDDLVLRDDLESTYGDDDNSGDALGNAQEDEDRRDIVSRIMKSRRKKDRLPNPA